MIVPLCQSAPQTLFSVTIKFVHITVFILLQWRILIFLPVVFSFFYARSIGSQHTEI